jgi:hypothetical protein
MKTCMSVLTIAIASVGFTAFGCAATTDSPKPKLTNEEQCQKLSGLLENFADNPTRAPSKKERDDLLEALLTGQDDSVCSSGFVLAATDILLRGDIDNQAVTSCRKFAADTSHFGLVRASCIRLVVSKPYEDDWFIDLLKRENDPEVVSLLLQIPTDTALIERSMPHAVAILHTSGNLHTRATAALFLLRHRQQYAAMQQPMLIAASTQCDREVLRNMTGTLDSDAMAFVHATCAAYEQRALRADQ